jgi:hypothetical protein
VVVDPFLPNCALLSLSLKLLGQDLSKREKKKLHPLEQSEGQQSMMLHIAKAHGP